jgi:hypothetical protein
MNGSGGSGFACNQLPGRCEYFANQIDGCTREKTSKCYAILEWIPNNEDQDVDDPQYWYRDNNEMIKL